MGGALLQSALLEWYRANRRDLPWRGEDDPYRILLSEVLLQQTRVEQAIPYYHRLLERFPTLEALAKAPLEEVLQVWQGAGYYARARNLHRLSQQTPALPAEYSRLRQLPGLGPYTAAAVASIAFGQPVAAVDGNVRRVLSRLFAWENPTSRQVQEKADRLLQREAPGDWNQALMELGATICTKNPRCMACPVSRWCKGKNHPQRYPAPQPRHPQEVQLVALVLEGPQGIYLEPRSGPLLGGLWGVPLAEGLEELKERLRVEMAEYAGEVHHAFTHRKLTVRVYRARWEGAGYNPADKPLSRLDQKILNKIPWPSAAPPRTSGRRSPRQGRTSPGRTGPRAESA
ncbi:A/G-specific adenine glycosylase [Meiothermus sp. PNK-Is4]|nr:A/G-specific adenine glycosylase [Meiothermus sp. Pnk-1]RYM36416.1 A/G-specific adenine glycosylase [Meiothermus sp. PNK-Is4]